MIHSINAVGKIIKNLGATVYGFGRRESILLATTDYQHISKYFNKSNLEELLMSVDYVISVLPNTEETTNLLGNGILESCSKGNFLYLQSGYYLQKDIYRW